MSLRLTGQNFDVMISGVTILVDFYKDGCVPCRRMSPVLAELEEQHPEVAFAKVNAEMEKELAEKLEIRSVPTLILFRNGAEVGRLTGVQSRQKVEELIGNSEGGDTE